MYFPSHRQIWYNYKIIPTVAYYAIVLVPLNVTPNYPFQKQGKLLVVN